MGQEGHRGTTALIGALLLATAAAPSAGLEGYWTNARQTVVVQIAECDRGVLCGRAVAASDKAKADARRGGTSTFIGTEVLGQLVPTAPGRWTAKLFVPDLNRRSTANIQLLDENRLRIRGCAVGKILCRSQLWYRTSAPDNDGQLP